MRWDIHNHTIVPHRQTRLSSWQKQIQPENLLTILHQHHLDGVAITNHQEIKAAQELAGQYPEQVLVGAEYRVVGHESTYITIAVLNVDQPLHSTLLQARMRGLSYFARVVQEHQCPYYLTHLGTGITPDHAYSCELLEEALSQIPALLVSDHTGICDFAFCLARYYQLTMIGGSGQLLPTSQRSYTEYVLPEPSPISQPDNHTQNLTAPQMICQAILQKQVTVGISTELGFQKSAWTSLWEESKKSYREEIARIWHSEWNWQQPWNFSEMAQRWLGPTIQALPQAIQLRRSQKLQQQLQQWKRKFFDYLQLKEIKRITQLSCPAEEKRQQWIEAAAKIYQSFSQQSS